MEDLSKENDYTLQKVIVKLPLYAPVRFRKTLIPADAIEALDSVKDLAFKNHALYTLTRNKLFPEDVTGSKKKSQ